MNGSFAGRPLKKGATAVLLSLMLCGAVLYTVFAVLGTTAMYYYGDRAEGAGTAWGAEKCKERMQFDLALLENRLDRYGNTIAEEIEYSANQITSRYLGSNIRFRVWMLPQGGSEEDAQLVIDTLRGQGTGLQLKTVYEPLNQGSEHAFRLEASLLEPMVTADHYWLYQAVGQALNIPPMIYSVLAVVQGLIWIAYVIKWLILCSAQMHVMHRVPLGGYLLAEVGFGALVYGVLAILARQSSAMFAFWIGTAFVALGLAAFWSVLLLLTTVVTRVRHRMLLKTTAVYYLLQLLRRVLRWVMHTTTVLSHVWGVVVCTVCGCVACFLIYITERSLPRFAVLLLPILLAGTIGVLWVIQKNRLSEAIGRLANGDFSAKLDADATLPSYRTLAENFNHISDGMASAVEAHVKSERMKTELITNVSHDIKTPLTSMINYTDLLSREDLQNDTAAEYVRVLVRHSERLKKLIDDLLEASKAATGNLKVTAAVCECGVLMAQIVGEYEEALAQNGLELVVRTPCEAVTLLADERHLRRIIDNLMSNICKYSQKGTRVYVTTVAEETAVHLVFRNISESALEISPEELTERFVRGDASRNSEGSGLGLSIARSLSQIQGGDLQITVDGDLFKVTVTLPRAV